MESLPENLEETIEEESLGEIAEKPYEEEILMEEESPYVESEVHSDEAITEIEKQIDEVEEMISKEEENYAVLEKKIHDMEENEESSSKVEDTVQVDDHEDEKQEVLRKWSKMSDIEKRDFMCRFSTEEWLASLVPDLKKYISKAEDDISDEKTTVFDEEAVLAAENQAMGEMVLDEDNPLVRKFQAVLREHLLRQITKLQTSVLELEGEFKKKESVLKEDADSAYKMQQSVIRQRENLENYKNTIEQVGSQRERIESELKDQNKQLDEIRQTFEERKFELERCQSEANMLNDLVKKMSDYDKEQEKEISLSKKMQDINKKDKEILSKEKQAQDMLLWKYQKKLLEQRRETDARLKRCKMKSDECQALSSRLLQATVERAGLLMENQAISKEIQKAFLNIKQTDTRLQKTKDELENTKINWGKLQISLKWYKKNLKILMEQNETLLEEKRKTQDDFQFLTDKIETMRNKEKRAIEELNAFDELMKTADKDFYEAVQLGNALRADEDTLNKKIAKATCDKAILEKTYIEKLSSVERTDKQVKNMSELLLKMIEEHKKQELKMYKMENDVAKLMVEMESMKGILRDIDCQKESLNRKIVDAEQTLRKYEVDLKAMKETELKMKNSVFEKKKELEKLESVWKHKTYIDSPLLKKKNCLLESIKNLQKSVDEKEKLWVELQEGCLRATKKRNVQLEKINLYRKQVRMIDASIQRSCQQLKEEQQELRQIIGDIKTVTHKLELLHNEELKQGNAKQKAETLNRDREEEFIEVLKGLERSVLNIQQEIWNLEEENQEKVEAVELLQNELLEWNKKYSLAIEMKKEIEVEKSKGGEINAMKQEIHRMEVRYSNLRKAEERLINDLELSLSRRDAIVESAEAREKRAKACGITARAQAWRRIEETKTKLRSIIREVRELKKEKELCLEKRKKLSDELVFWRSSVDRLSESLVQLEFQIQEGQVHRHKTLEMTVMRQRKTKLLEDLRMGRYRVATTEDNLLVQEENVFAIHNALLHIIEELKNDFPTLHLQLLQIENTISYNVDPEME